MIDLGDPSAVADWVTVAMTKPADYSIMTQFIIQAKAVGVCVVWTAVVAFIAFKIADLVVGYRTKVKPPSTTNICPVA